MLAWPASKSVLAGEEELFRRGDVDGDGKVGIVDAVQVLDALFFDPQPLPCEDAADADDSGLLNIQDPVFIFAYLAGTGPPPPSPGPETCGTDPTADARAACTLACPAEPEDTPSVPGLEFFFSVAGEAAPEGDIVLPADPGGTNSITVTVHLRTPPPDVVAAIPAWSVGAKLGVSGAGGGDGGAGGATITIPEELVGVEGTDAEGLFSDQTLESSGLASDDSTGVVSGVLLSTVEEVSLASDSEPSILQFDADIVPPKKDPDIVISMEFTDDLETSQGAEVESTTATELGTEGAAGGAGLSIQPRAPTKNNRRICIRRNPELPRFVRGDANTDGTVDLSDGITILLFLFAGGLPPSCIDATDTNDSGGTQPDISDAILIFNWLFQGGPPPASPFPGFADYSACDCGLDLTADSMDCEAGAAVCE